MYNNPHLHNMLNSTEHTPKDVLRLVMFAENYIGKRLTLRDMLEKEHLSKKITFKGKFGTDVVILAKGTGAQ